MEDTARRENAALGMAGSLSQVRFDGSENLALAGYRLLLMDILVSMKKTSLVVTYMPLVTPEPVSYFS